ncbi:MAG: PHP domain-containing protein [Peptococcaceae bacterium]|jgi:putative hydrolase|nr:PHP domain-containing protein [Peptococcaceae bacterium]
MLLEADLHTHTLASGHAFSTVREMAQYAARKRLKMIAVTDHGVRMPGGPDENYFRQLRGLPDLICGVEVLKGVEANIVDGYGNLDMPPDILENLDLVLAGFHDGTGYQGGSVEQNTAALVAAIHNPLVHIIAHPGNPLYPVELEKIVMAAKAAGKALEINNGSFTFRRPGSGPRCEYMAKLAAKSSVLVSVVSDAHNCFTVGAWEHAVAVAERAGIRPENVVNSSTGLVREFLRRNKQRIRKIS